MGAILGRDYSGNTPEGVGPLGEARRGGQPPHGPPYTPNRGSRLGFASRFASILGLDCMQFTTLFL